MMSLVGISLFLSPVLSQATTEVIDISHSTCSNYIAETWSLVGQRVVIENDRIFLCEGECKDSQLYGVEITEGLVGKLQLKPGKYGKTLASACASRRSSKINLPNKCTPNGLDIFKVMIPFTGPPSEICFCDYADGSMQMTLCRNVNGKHQAVGILAAQPLRSTLNSTCQITAISGAAVACLCSQQNPTHHANYLKCLREQSTAKSDPINPLQEQTIDR